MRVEVIMADQKVVELVSNITSNSTKTTIGASGTSIVAWFSHLDLVACIGAVVGVLGLFISFATFIVNLHYKKKEDKRAQKMYEIEYEKAKERIKYEK